MAGKWKTELTRVTSATKGNDERAKKHAAWHAALSIAASKLSKAASSQGADSRRSYNQLLIQQKALINALKKLSVLEVDAAKAKKAKDKKKIAELANEMKAYESTYNATKKAYNAANTKGIACADQIAAAAAAVAAVPSP